MQDIQGKIVGLLEQAVIVTDAEGVITFMNPFAERLYGWKASEVLGRGIVEVMVPDISRDQALQILSTLKEGKSWSGEFRVRRRDGATFLAMVTDTPVLDDRGRLSGILGVSSDITERKLLEETVVRSEARFRALLEHSPVGVFETDEEGRVTYLNGAGQDLVGLPSAAALGTGWHHSIHPEDRERVVREWRCALASAKEFATEYRVRNLKGRSILVRGAVIALPERPGRAAGYVGAVSDITASRAFRAQVALAARLSAIESMVADIRNVIDDWTGDERSEAQRGLDRARESSERVARALQDLRRSAEATPGRIPVRLYDIVNQAIHWLPPGVTEGSSIKVEKDGSPQIRASPCEIEQVIVNLVSNAARAAPPGKRRGVVVRLGAGTPGMVRVEVSDRGPGIPSSTLEEILAPPFAANGRGEGGGLGLAVSQAIVASHGGTLTVDTRGGRGTSIRVELPAAGEGAGMTMPPRRLSK
jgi:PAS domain S-box-containing protein